MAGEREPRGHLAPEEARSSRDRHAHRCPPPSILVPFIARRATVRKQMED
jgi:hypothetical protein